MLVALFACIWFSFGKSSHTNTQLSIYINVAHNSETHSNAINSELKNRILKPIFTLTISLKSGIKSITDFEQVCGMKTVADFHSNGIKNWPKSLFRNLASCGIAHSIGIEKLCGIKRWRNSLERGKTAIGKQNLVEY